MAVIVELITFDKNIYQVVPLFPNCSQWYHVGLLGRTVSQYLKEALFVMCSFVFPPVLKTYTSVCCLVFLKCLKISAFLFVKRLLVIEY